MEDKLTVEEVDFIIVHLARLIAPEAHKKFYALVEEVNILSKVFKDGQEIMDMKDEALKEYHNETRKVRDILTKLHVLKFDLQ